MIRIIVIVLLFSTGIFLFGYGKWMEKDLPLRRSPFVLDTSEPFYHPYNLLISPILQKNIHSDNPDPQKAAKSLGIIIYGFQILGILDLMMGLFFLILPILKKQRA